MISLFARLPFFVLSFQLGFAAKPAWTLFIALLFAVPAIVIGLYISHKNGGRRHRRARVRV